MALCSHCLAIPFDSLPQPHPWIDANYAFGLTDIPYMRCDCDIDEDSDLEHVLGYTWHPDLYSLTSSASSCVLCGVIYKGLQEWLAKVEEGKAQRYYAENSIARHRHPPPHGRVLYLTQRLGGGPGFSIMVGSVRYKHEFYILPGVAFSVDENHPLAKAIRLRPPDVDSGSNRSLAVAKSFLGACQTQHDTCSSCLGSEALLPSRIIDVSSPDDLIRLIEPRAQQSGTYVCLSYCWGGTQQFTTTRQTISARLSGFHVNDLPATLRDAVKVVRHLEIRYIWIDCLCICQDDREDWARESARMADIYANAYLVLSANHAAGHTVGLFNNRTSLPSCRIDLGTHAQNVHVQLLNNSDEMDQDNTSKCEPLSERGWAFQERRLAQRILHYNSLQIYFECEMGVFGENGCFDKGRPHSLAALQTTSTTARQNLSTYHSQWELTVSDYSTRKLTYQTDKLPAIGGLAKDFASRIPAEYLAGVWSDNLINGLAWCHIRTSLVKPGSQYIAPSWSWASCPGDITMRGWGKRTDVAEALECKVHCKDAANPFGEVSGGYLLLRGPIVPLSSAESVVDKEDLDRASRRERAGVGKTRWVRTPYFGNGKSYYEVNLDYEEYFESDAWDALEMKLMLLSNVEDDNPNVVASAKHFSHGLILVDTQDLDTNQKKRIGWLDIDVLEAQEVCRDEVNWQTVTLV